MDHLATQFDLAMGDVVEVRIEQRTNVRLMTLTNYQAYRSLRDYRAVGSGFTAGVVRIAAPHAGRWVLVLDLAVALGPSDIAARESRGPLRKRAACSAS